MRLLAVSLLVVIFLVVAFPVYAQDPVSDSGTHDRLDTANSNLVSIDNELTTVNSNLVGLHNDLVVLQVDQAVLSGTLGSVDSKLTLILSATLALSDSLAVSDRSLVTPTGVVTVPQVVTHRYEVTSGDRMISILLVVLIIFEGFRMVFSATRGTNL